MRIICGCFVLVCVAAAVVSLHVDEEMLKEIVRELESLNRHGKDDQMPPTSSALPPGAHEIPQDDSSEANQEGDVAGEGSDGDSTDCGGGKPCGSKSSRDANEELLLYLAKLRREEEEMEEEEEEEEEKSGKIEVKQSYPGSQNNNNPCGRNQPMIVTDNSGSIMSPGFHNNSYSDGLSCSYRFEAPRGKAVRITIQTMDMEVSDNCQYDSLKFYDIQGNEGVLLGNFCGRITPQELVESTRGVLLVLFTSDVSGHEGRFSFQFDIVDPMPPAPSDPACGRPVVKPDLSQRIVNGRPAVPFSWPWQVGVRLLMNGKKFHICGGSILYKNIVITAAHCCFDLDHKGFDSSQLEVVAGDYDITTSQDGRTQTSSVTKIIVHSSYNPKYANSPFDIAALVLKKPVVYNDHVLPVCLSTQSPAVTSICYATGWGETQDTGNDNVLNQVRLPVIPQTICAQPTYLGRDIIDSKLCAGYQNGKYDACKGDSGGPFVCWNPYSKRWYLQGITSYGIGCARPKKPGVYTRVVKYLGWIYQNTGVTV